MARFMVWDEDNGDDSDAREVGAASAERAARFYGERQWSNSDYPEHQTLCVRDETGATTRWVVSAEQSVEFHVREAK